MQVDYDNIKLAAEKIRKSKYAVAFTGAGISVESGIQSFRGENGLWNKHHPIFLEIEYFSRKPLQSWKKIKEIFYDKFDEAEPNLAHIILQKMEKRGFIESIITQNVDNLHQKAGSKSVFELHGTSRKLTCIECSAEYEIEFADLNFLPPTCFVCKGILKPNMVFFNEPLPPYPFKKAHEEIRKADVLIIIGTTAEVYPANEIPIKAKENRANIIEINIRKSGFTDTITDIFIEGKATKIMKEIGKLLYLVD
jgi:NAD-dependent deacetylase